MNTRKVCVVTGSRAEYGLLLPLLRLLKQDPEFELQLVVTGMHLSPEFGLTYNEIINDGFIITECIETLLSSDTSVGIAKSIGLGTISFAESLKRLNPDLLVILGDRYEIFAAAQAALVARIPIAHIGGGDSTEGAFDEAIRHSITKMSHLHFVDNYLAADRVRQLGEAQNNVHNVGNPGLDLLKTIQLMNKEELAHDLDFSFKQRNILVTYHPVTLADEDPYVSFSEVLAGISQLDDDIGIIFTKPNADTGGRTIIRMIDDYTESHANAKAYTSLGQLRYFSAINAVDAVVGNSSSGICEVPFFKKPTVNIGERQKGRLQADSVINCKPVASQVKEAIEEAFKKDFPFVTNPYGSGDSAEKILNILKGIKDYRELLIKKFYKY